MSATVELPIRTQVRDVFVAALSQIEQNPDARITGAEIVTDYLHETEIKKAVSYGVIVTDENVSVSTQRMADVSLTVLIVIYARSETDRRALLDAAIEDLWETLRGGQVVKAMVPRLELESIETDEAAAAAKPYAQAKMRWLCRGIRRAVSW